MMAVTEKTNTKAELVPVGQSVTLFRTENPNEVVTRASETANALAAVVKQKKLTVKIQGREHVLVEGWTLLGAMLGVFPVCAWSRKLENGWEARVEARTKEGALIGAAEAMCLRSERTWASRDDYALRSMAQTRATSKALRQPLGFVMSMAGFSATPAEEMIVDAEITEVVQRGDDTTPASEPQAKNIWRLINKLDKTGTLAKDSILEAMGKEYGTEKPIELYKQQASDLITRLKAKAGEE